MAKTFEDIDKDLVLMKEYLGWQIDMVAPISESFKIETYKKYGYIPEGRKRKDLPDFETWKKLFGKTLIGLRVYAVVENGWGIRIVSGVINRVRDDEYSIVNGKNQWWIKKYAKTKEEVLEQLDLPDLSCINPKYI